MNLHVGLNAGTAVHDTEQSFDSMFVEAMDCLKREPDPNLELLVLFESMKQQVMDLADERTGGIGSVSECPDPYRQALMMLEEQLLQVDDVVGEARSTLLLLLSMAYYRAGNLSYAMNMALLARSEYIVWGLEHRAWFADLMLAMCYMELQQYEQAADRCVLALSETSLSDNPVSVAQIWQVYGRILLKLERSEEAVAGLVIASEIFRQQGNVARQVKALLELSLILVRLEDFNGAIYRLKQALTICYQKQLKTLELEVLHMLAHLFMKTGRTAEGEGCRRRIRQIVGRAR